MYRSERIYGSGVRDLQEIITFEVSELWNTDVFVYSLDHYGEYFDSHLADTLKLFAYDDDYLAAFGSTVGNTVEAFLHALNRGCGHHLRYGLWLAEKSRFPGDMQPELDAYLTSDVILSDLGSDGKLFAYENMPQPITIY